MNTQRLTSVSLSLLTLAVLPFAAACGSEKSGDSQTVGSGTGTTKSGSPDVTGIHWRVEDLTVDGKKSAAPASAYLQIGKDGEVSGNYGCNSFGATAKVDGDDIALGTARSTDMACGNDRMTFESAFSKALTGGALTAQVKGDGEQQLTLTTKAGATIHLTEEKASSLYGTKWTVTTVGDAGADSGVSPLPSAADTYLVFDQKKGTVRGKAGCNNVSAEATVSDGAITFGSPATTRRMCDASLMKAERAFLKLFDGKAAYKIDHRSLSLTSENGTTVAATVAD
ncbi:META domain-containing protein [Streptomyces sp. ME02-8801-2C]|uniref:META domain-containing protein n=1 Tax=Streptomyces sp. ME02-8801-2C TaxID=3028680 RepID=UPI0029B429CB|nr:META domain-containing protein [Streptomyces sp. ME02-8801-2C]MDX3458010.1 META domain-containing protein [Streptomyces sp. ME02-8801-2C]